MKIQNDTLARFAELVEKHKCNPSSGDLKVGIDLGTANIVISVIDSEGNSVGGAMHPSKVVKDGIVVDFVGAINIIKKLKQNLENSIGRSLNTAAVAVPPGIIKGNVRCMVNVAEAAGFEVINVVDEPTAAASILNIRNGAVVDVGGGTTGISILKDGNVIFSSDEPTGGIHMTLVLAGYYGISVDEAEKIKTDVKRHEEIFPIIKPVVDKMASIAEKYITPYDVPDIYVVGGASSFKEFCGVFEKRTGIETITFNEPLLVTPLGIAMHCKEAVGNCGF